MCYLKKRLKNKILDEHRSGFDKVFINAPCGSCPSCRKVKANDWLVRSYFEFLGNHRSAFFLSLDFDNEHLPVYKGVACFDTKVMALFLARLRQQIGRFRYMYATDYGGILKRPHYHMILLPEQDYGLPYILSMVNKTWQQGHCTNVEQIPTIANNKLKAMSYVVSYTTKDISFNLNDDVKDMPLRFRPRVQASKGFGLKAIEDGIITKQSLMDSDMISLPIGRDGALVSLPVPRYYEMQLGYDRSWDARERKESIVKNAFGVELCKIRHNSHYKYYIRSFMSSRFFDMSKIPDIDLSYFGNAPWRSIVYDCLSDIHDFAEFVYFRSFIDSYGSRGFVHDTVRGDFVYRPQWQYYEAAAQVYDKYVKYFDKIKCDLEVSKLVQAAKVKARLRIQRDPELRSYLRRKHFDFNNVFT